MTKEVDDILANYSAESPGVRANLDAMFAQVRDRVISLVRQRDAFGRFCTAVYLKMSHHGDILGLDSYARGYEPLLAELPRLQNTRDAAELAERILQQWLSEHPPAERPYTPVTRRIFRRWSAP